MKISDLREKTETELKKMLAAEQEKVRDLRFRVSQRQLKNLREIRKAKKLIARILTIKKEKTTK
jgi:ribosomal protein L29